MTSQHRDLRARGLELLDRAAARAEDILDNVPEHAAAGDLPALAMAGLGYILADLGILQPDTHVDATGAPWYRDRNGRYRRIDSIAGDADSLTLTELRATHGTFTPPHTAR